VKRVLWREDAKAPRGFAAVLGESCHYPRERVVVGVIVANANVQLGTMIKIQLFRNGKTTGQTECGTVSISVKRLRKYPQPLCDSGLIQARYSASSDRSLATVYNEGAHVLARPGLQHNAKGAAWQKVSGAIHKVRAAANEPRQRTRAHQRGDTNEHLVTLQPSETAARVTISPKPTEGSIAAVSSASQQSEGASVKQSPLRHDDNRRDKEDDSD
jgi:hypothetical protein